jgi:hypothetical protein
MSSKDILRELLSDAELLIKRQVTLARAEAKQQLKTESGAMKLLGAAGAIAYGAVVVLLVAVGLAIGQAIGAAWAGVLVVGCALLVPAAILGGLGWARRERQPLPRSSAEIRKEITWARREATT